MAWAIARDLALDSVVTDLDLAFGTAGLDYNQDPPQGIARRGVLTGPVDTAFIDRLLSKCTDHLSLLAAPATLDGVLIGIEGVGADIIDPVERRRRRQQAEMVGAFRQQAVDEGGIDAIRREHGIRNTLRRVLVVVEPGRAEGRSRSATTESIARSRAIAQATLWEMVEAPTPPLAPTTAMMRPTALASGAENRLQIERTTSIAPTGAST